MIYRHFDVAMNVTLVIWIVTLIFTFYAAWIDWRVRRIPNWLTVPGFFLGIGLHVVIGGWHGAVSSLEGAAFALVALLPFVLLRGLGAGDWKMMGAIGALLGPLGLLVVLFASVMISGLMALAMIIWAHRVTSTLRNMAVLVQGFFVFGWRGNPEITLDNPGLLKLPFGVAAAAATLICFVLSRWMR